jgi:hypothetical protein
MPGTTPAQGWRIPIAADDPDVVDDVTQLAKLIEKRVMGVYSNASQRDAATTAAGIEEGMFAFTKDTNSVWYFDGSSWISFPPAQPLISSGPSVPSNASGANGDVFFQY